VAGLWPAKDGRRAKVVITRKSNDPKLFHANVLDEADNQPFRDFPRAPSGTAKSSPSEAMAELIKRLKAEIRFRNGTDDKRLEMKGGRKTAWVRERPAPR